MCLICDDDDTSYHDDPGHDSYDVLDCTGSAETCTATDHTPWWAHAAQDANA